MNIIDLEKTIRFLIFQQKEACPSEIGAFPALREPTQRIGKVGLKQISTEKIFHI
jgi:hypothetical protein